ncbi:MAG: radical SAM protein [Dehalococcoidales bacterium]|nr:radical SAM protein [Dehalococcoidales bacterium]
MLFPGRKGPFVFERQPVILPAKPASLNLYIHLPFCRQLCPFCPYMKEVYDPAVSAAYQEALLQELESYRRLWGDVNIESVYFGGGTPSMTPEIIERTLSWIAGNFHLGHEVGVEVNPLDAHPAVISSFKNSGVSLVSLGVQSFHDRLLGLLGRDYDGKLARQASERLLQAGFATVDADLIFAIPTQSRQEVEADVETACELGVDQISTYPLLYFSYAPLRKQLHQARVTTPSWWLERQMLAAIVKKTQEAGYRRTSIWSFNRPETIRYTTVTKDAFVGIGAGATSKIGDYFKLNTFSVAEYIKAMAEGSPLALATKLDAGDKMAYWFFWRVYDLDIDTSTFQSIFGQDLPRRVRALLSLLKLLGMTQRRGNTIRLTEMGAYIFHLIEKEYTHAYLETMWQACLQEAWPQRVVL